LAETLVAFANADGGTILVGVDAKGGTGHAYAEEIEGVCARRSAARSPVQTGWSVEAEGGSAGDQRAAQPGRTRWRTAAC
jgi:hypothetical protein